MNWANSSDPDYVPICAGQQQSPINIITEDTIELGQDDLPKLRKACGEVEGKFKIDGNTLKFVPIDDKAQISNSDYMSGGPLGTDKYYFLQFHLHWGYYGCNGSEHTINQNR